MVRRCGRKYLNAAERVRFIEAARLALPADLASVAALLTMMADR